MNEEAKAQLAAITSGPSTRLREIVAGVDAMMTPGKVVQVPPELLRAILSEVDGLRLALRGFIEGLERTTSDIHRLREALDRAGSRIENARLLVTHTEASEQPVEILLKDVREALDGK